jgi:FKBP-type peptidyl-prolyl cis-trans isomerase (trigger factor)
MTIDFAIDTIYKQALKKEKIIPVAQAEIKEIISESPLKIKVHIEVLPEVEIDKKYKKIKLKKVPVKVDTSEVKKALEEIETKFTKFEIDETKKKKAKM